MSRILFRQIQPGSRLLAIGNFFKASNHRAPWRLAALTQYEGTSQLQRFPLEMSCVLGVGREFLDRKEAPYRSGGFKKTVVLPALNTWREQRLGECPRLAKKLAATPELSGQRCFVFQVGGMTVWLPKFELARKLFFHSAFIARTAFEPNGLDMAFTIYNDGGVAHIHTPAKTGAPSQLIKTKSYRDHFSWLLLNQDVKRSFESVWQSLNREQEQTSQDSAYIRWAFDFMPPASLVGVTINVRGPFDLESNELLIWEIETLQGLRSAHRGDVFFHHPALKLPVKGESTGSVTVPSGAEELEVDAEDEPTDAKDPRLIHLPVEGITFDSKLSTKIAYEGERAGDHGKTVVDEQCASKESSLIGVADPVSGGSLAPGEFQQLGDGEESEQFADRFSQLREVIEQIAQESDITLVFLEVNPLPPVPRCSYHMIGGHRPRCYLFAGFTLKNGNRRYLLEIDTSDSRKTLSTRVMGFKEGVEARKCVERILKGTVKGSLRWPASMAKYCDPMYSVHHPKESSSGANHVRLCEWKLRIRMLLS